MTGSGTVDITGSGAIFAGPVTVSGATAALTIGGAGATFDQGLTVEAGAAVTLSGADLTLSGGFALDSGTLALTGAGLSLPGGGSVAFGSAAAWNLVLSTASPFSSTVSNFTSLDTIDIEGLGNPIGLTDASLDAGNLLTISGTSGTYQVQLDPSRSYNGYQFDTVSDSSGSGVETYLQPTPHFFSIVSTGIATLWNEIGSGGVDAAANFGYFVSALAATGTSSALYLSSGDTLTLSAAICRRAAAVNSPASSSVRATRSR